MMLWTRLLLICSLWGVAAIIVTSVWEFFPQNAGSSFHETPSEKLTWFFLTPLWIGLSLDGVLQGFQNQGSVVTYLIAPFPVLLSLSALFIQRRHSFGISFTILSVIVIFSAIRCGELSAYVNGGG